MNQYWRPFLQICLFRGGPQDVPASHGLMGIALLIYMLLGVVLSSLEFSWIASIGRIALDTLLMALVVWSLLAWRNHRGRFVQTFSALLGTGAILSLIAWPIMLWLFAAGEQDGQAGAAVPAMLWLVIVFWSLGITGHIFRHALNISFPLGTLIAVLYVIMAIYLLNAIFVPPA